jgi:hypothetical protein
MPIEQLVLAAHLITPDRVRLDLARCRCIDAKSRGLGVAICTDGIGGGAAANTFCRIGIDQVIVVNLI